MSFKKITALYPFLIVLYPFLHLYRQNLFLFSFSDVIPLLLITLGITTILFLLVKLIFKDDVKAGVFLSVILIFFFSWGHILDIAVLMSKTSPRIIESYFSFFCMMLFVFSLVAVLFWLVKTRLNLGILESFLKFTTSFLIISSVAIIGMKIIKTNSGFLTAELKKDVETQAIQNIPNILPDIYHIVLDGYGRADILKEIYNYDNSEFLSCLKDKGFYVAEETRSNYAQSCLSVASFLNFEYISDDLPKNSQDRSPLAEMFKNNKVAQFLKKIGYKFVNFPIGYFCVDSTPLADLNIDTGSVLSDKLFEDMFLYTTALRPWLSGQRDVDQRRRRILNVFPALEKIAESKESTFVYTHVVAPHPPFIFGPEGEEVIQGHFCLAADGNWWVGRCGTQENYIEGYRNQLIYLNKLVCGTIEKILSNSDTPPIIVLQADHGPGAMTIWEDPEKTNMKERLGILNAYYLPGNGKELLYSSITPVNTYRIILNHYFGTNYEILEDKSYFSIWSRPYQFIEVLREEAIK